jgi:hypothetical protein
MKKAVWSGIIAAAGLFVMSTSAFAQQTANGTVTVNATVSARAKLALANSTTHTINFGDADPDVTAVLSAPAFNVDVKARTSANSSVTLTVSADGDLMSGTDAIAISNLRWTATGAQFVNGTSDSASEVAVGSWTGSGSYAGTQTYTLQNSWAYATGNYSVLLTYTLTAP